MSDKLWFNIESLQRLTDSRTWQKGSEIYFSSQVLSLEIELTGDGEWGLFGTVRGTHYTPYKVQAALKLNTEARPIFWSNSCTCPVHHGCKHGMALLIYAAFNGHELLRKKFPEGLNALAEQRSKQFEAEQALKIQRKAEAETRQAEQRLLAWFAQIDRVTKVERDPVTAEVALGTFARHSKPAYQYLYLLSLTDQSTATPKLKIDAVSTYLKQNGHWAKARLVVSIPMDHEIVTHSATRTDIEIMRLIAPPTRLPSYYRDVSTISGVPEGRLGVMAIELAASTGKLFLSDSALSPGKPVLWGSARSLAWAWQESGVAPDSDTTWALRASPAPHDSTTLLCFNSPPLYLDQERGICGLIASESLSTTQIEALLVAPPLKESMIHKYQSALTARLGIIPRPPVLAELPMLKGITPIRRLHVRRTTAVASGTHDLIRAELTFDYDGHCAWWGDQTAVVTLETRGHRLLLHRDLSFENATIEVLFFDLNIDVDPNGLCTLADHIPQVQWVEWFDRQFSDFSKSGFEVTIDDNLKNWVHHSDQLIVDMVASDPESEESSDWFDLSLGIEIDGKRRNILPFLPMLLNSAKHDASETGLRRLPAFVYLPDEQSDRYLRIPTAEIKPWLETMLDFFAEHSSDFSNDQLRLTRFEAMLASTMLGEGVQWQGAQAIRALAQKLNNSALLEQVAVPATVRASLRSYQQDGLNWLQFLGQYGFGGILADDMGLGKTLQTLAHIQVEKDAGRLTTPALVIVPVSVLGNWQREANKFCPQLRILIIHGKARHSVIADLSEFDVVIAPYSLLQRDRSRWLDITWHLVVLDEAQNIKNANTQAAHVVREIRARQRLCLSGTPIENHLGELWSLFHFLMPGFLGSQKRFGEVFRKPIEKQNNTDRLRNLRARITPFMLRRTKVQVASELPPKIETAVRVELSGKQADLYETIRLTTEKAVREALATRGFAKSRVTILDALLKLRQVCCDPRLVPSAVAKKIQQSAKLTHLMDVLPEMLAEGRRILLFSQFTSMLSLIETELAKQNLTWVKLTGSSQNRDALVERFTSGEIPLFLISLKAGGVGLNLPQADTVIHYDPWWNPAVENQATDRAHRIGQTQKVWVIKLVAQGTIEERILAMQERKAGLAESLYSDAVARKKPLFTETDLADLLKPLGA